MAVTGQLRCSKHYLWSPKDILGKGATGEVLRCRDKNTGEIFAIKTFNSNACLQAPDIQIREIEVLRRLKHENIVKVLAIEEEQHTQHSVIIMELCNGGSVHSMLEDPENNFGVSETIFLRILEDIANGMMYLKKLRIVHRDIKPGNILCSIEEDGKRICKLTDFGAARELQEEEQFMSLHGTEEYLEPAMFQRAVLKRGHEREFDSSVDLWSLGVTLCHIATGQLPFRPFGGRLGSKETMHKITTEKQSGVISGYQEVERGPIIWSKELPITCQLSQGVKTLVTPIIAGLLERDLKLKWTFQQFYDEAKQIVNKIVIFLFIPHKCDVARIYADETITLAYVQELIAQQTSVPAVHQCLIHEYRYLADIVKPTQTVKTYPRTTETTPLVLFQANDCGSEDKLENKEIPKFPRFGTIFSLDNDAPLAKCCATILYKVKRHVEHYGLVQKLLIKSIKMISWIIVDSIKKMYLVFEHVLLRVEQVGSQVTYFCKSHEERIETLNLLFANGDQDIPSDVIDCRKKLNGYCQDLNTIMGEVTTNKTDISRHINEYFDRVVRGKELESKWRWDLGCNDPDVCIDKVKFQLTSVLDTLEQFRKDKLLSRLTYNEEQIHKVDKNNMNTCCSKAVSICQDACFANLRKLHHHFTTVTMGGRIKGWESFVMQVKVRTDRLNAKTSTLSDNELAVETELAQRQDMYGKKYKELLFLLKNKVIRPLPMTGNAAQAANSTTALAVSSVQYASTGNSSQIYKIVQEQDSRSTENVKDLSEGVESLCIQISEVTNKLSNNGYELQKIENNPHRIYSKQGATNVPVDSAYTTDSGENIKRTQHYNT